MSVAQVMSRVAHITPTLTHVPQRFLRAVEGVFVCFISLCPYAAPAGMLGSHCIYDNVSSRVAHVRCVQYTNSYTCPAHAWTRL